MKLLTNTVITLDGNVSIHNYELPSKTTSIDERNGVFTRSSKRPAIHVYFEYICWKFAKRLLDRVNTLLILSAVCCIKTVLVFQLLTFLRATVGTAAARLSHCNSVRLSVTRVDQSKTVQARITKSLPSAAWKH